MSLKKMSVQMYKNFIYNARKTWKMFSLSANYCYTPYKRFLSLYIVFDIKHVYGIDIYLFGLGLHLHLHLHLFGDVDTQ
jgi:hypothetical protein